MILNTLLLCIFIIININNYYKRMDYNLRNTFNYNLKLYYINTEFNFNIYNFVVFLFSAYINELIYFIAIYEIFNIRSYIKNNKGNYIFNINDIILYLFILNTTDISFCKNLALFGLAFSDIIVHNI